MRASSSPCEVAIRRSTFSMMEASMEPGLGASELLAGPDFLQDRLLNLPGGIARDP